MATESNIDARNGVEVENQPQEEVLDDSKKIKNARKLLSRESQILKVFERVSKRGSQSEIRETAEELEIVRSAIDEIPQNIYDQAASKEQKEKSRRNSKNASRPKPTNEEKVKKEIESRLEKEGKPTRAPRDIEGLDLGAHDAHVKAAVLRPREARELYTATDTSSELDSKDSIDNAVETHNKGRNARLKILEKKVENLPENFDPNNTDEEHDAEIENLEMQRGTNRLNELRDKLGYFKDKESKRQISHENIFIDEEEPTSENVQPHRLPRSEAPISIPKKLQETPVAEKPVKDLPKKPTPKSKEVAPVVSNLKPEKQPVAPPKKKKEVISFSQEEYDDAKLERLERENGIDRLAELRNKLGYFKNKELKKRAGQEDASIVDEEFEPADMQPRPLSGPEISVSIPAKPVEKIVTPDKKEESTTAIEVVRRKLKKPEKSPEPIYEVAPAPELGKEKPQKVEVTRRSTTKPETIEEFDIDEVTGLMSVKDLEKWLESTKELSREEQLELIADESNEKSLLTKNLITRKVAERGLGRLMDRTNNTEDLQRYIFLRGEQIKAQDRINDRINEIKALKNTSERVKGATGDLIRRLGFTSDILKTRETMGKAKRFFSRFFGGKK